MKMQIIKLLCLAAILFLCGSCVGPDFTPDYFGLRTEQDTNSPPPPPPVEDVSKTGGITILKLVSGADGRQIEVPIPENNIMEIGTGTFIGGKDTDVGEKYFASAKFKIVNAGDESIKFSLPSKIGPFNIDSLGKLEKELPPKKFIIINITFKPTSANVQEGGKVSEEIEIGEDTFKLSAIALEPAGIASVNVIDQSGNISIKDAAMLTFEEIALSAIPLRRFFKCDRIKCDGQLMNKSCTKCLDATGGVCKLLPVNKNGEPIDEVDDLCKFVESDRNPAQEINLAGTDVMTTKVKKMAIEIRNTGTEPVIVNSIKISEMESSKSKQQFSINSASIYVADDFSEINRQITEDYDAGQNTEHASFPLVLPPYSPPTLNARIFMAVAYHPNDIIGSEGETAAVGTSSKDEAILEIELDEGKKQIALVGTTTIREIPALQVYAKSSTGIRPIADGDILPFRGITMETADLSLPLFMKLSETSSTGLRISSIGMTGENFEWLNTKELIESKPAESRCQIPLYDDKGVQTGIVGDLNPVSLNPNGFALEPGAHTIDSMPLFGCLNFHRDTAATPTSRMFKATVKVTTQEISSSGQPVMNPDGSIRETSFTFDLLGVIDPIKGAVVMRLAQTTAITLNQQYPSISAAAADPEMRKKIERGTATEADRDLFLMALYLDPFDEDYIYDQHGKLVSAPGDGITAVLRPLDTRATSTKHDNPELPDYISLMYDYTLPEGEQGIFTGYPNVPADLQTPGLKIFTGTLSYPGPVVAPEDRPDEPSNCEIIDPCTAEGQRRLSEGPSDPRYKGVCAFFYVGAGKYDSPAFHYSTETPSGKRRDMCTDRDKPYELNAITGHYSVDGKLEFDDMGMLFQGPTYFHTPYGPLGPVAPLDEMMHLTFTTETILPISETKDIDRIPDKKVDIAKGEYKINLNDPYSDLTSICEANTGNGRIAGETYSTWKYIAKLLKKDKEGKIPAGCPEEDNNFTGGIAYLTGRRLNHETGVASFVTASKFSSSENLTFAFKDVMSFMVLSGWICDPAGSEDEMEGSLCFGKQFSYRDAASQLSVTE